MMSAVMCVLAATKRIVPILLGAPLLRASDGSMHTLSVARPRGGSITQEQGCVRAW